jgi:hypothetical protein
LTDTQRLRVRLANFAAFHLPGAPEGLIPQGDSPVNLFRRILSYYLGTDHPPLENRHFRSNYRTPYALEDVTERVK